jgi:hypothetical protein
MKYTPDFVPTKFLKILKSWKFDGVRGKKTFYKTIPNRFSFEYKDADYD